MQYAYYSKAGRIGPAYAKPYYISPKAKPCHTFSRALRYRESAAY